MKSGLSLIVLTLSAAAGAGGLVSTAFAQDTTLTASTVESTARPAPRPSRGAPAPLIAGGIPGALALGGAYLVIRRRRRKG